MTKMLVALILYLAIALLCLILFRRWDRPCARAWWYLLLALGWPLIGAAYLLVWLRPLAERRERRR
jgi:4-amino-4-deoxy-L-arabinose transferase-like glycosyltransferase